MSSITFKHLKEQKALLEKIQNRQEIGEIKDELLTPELREAIRAAGGKIVTPPLDCNHIVFFLLICFLAYLIVSPIVYGIIIALK